MACWTMRSAIIRVLMLSFLVQNKPTISTPPPSCCRQNTYKHSQTKGKDNNGHRRAFIGQRQVFQCCRVVVLELGTKLFSTTYELIPNDPILRFLCTTNRLQQAQISFVIDLISLNPCCDPRGHDLCIRQLFKEIHFPVEPPMSI